MKAVVRSVDDVTKFRDRIADSLDGKPFLLEIKPYKRGRTLDQNAKLHAMIRDLAVFTGYTEAQMKDIAKAEFAPIEVLHVGGKALTVPKQTSSMDVSELGDIIERLYELGAEIGCTFADA